MKCLNYLMDHILYQIFKIISIILSKKYQRVADNPPVRTYVNKIENRIKTKYYLELLMPETIKSLGNTKNKIIKVKMVKMFLV